MRFGLTLPPFDVFADARLVAEVAREAEAAGWEGFFVWDHLLLWPTPIADAWVTLTAVALATSRVLLGPMVTPLPRRRPVKLAREVVTLDHLSNGRLVLGVGIGDGPWEWDNLGEERDLRVRGQMLDEGLDLLVRLWSGEPVFHRGQFYTFHGDGGVADPTPRPTPFLPTPRQRPRVPIWVAGKWPNRKPFRRAARWDGVVPLSANVPFGGRLTPEQVREVVTYVAAHRPRDVPFEVVVGGHTTGTDPSADAAVVLPFREAGATWWLEDVSPWPFGWTGKGSWPVEAMRERIRSGPPRPGPSVG